MNRHVWNLTFASNGVGVCNVFVFALVRMVISNHNKQLFCPSERITQTHINILISHLSYTTWILSSSPSKITCDHNKHEVYNGVLWIAECVFYTRWFEPWYIYLWKKTANMRTQKFARERVWARMHTNVIHLSVCWYAPKHKHSLCINGGNVDGDDGDDDGGSGGGGSNNLSINQVHYSLRRICTKTATTTTSAHSDRSRLPVWLVWSVVWSSMVFRSDFDVTRTHLRCKIGSYAHEQFMLAPAPSHQPYSELREWARCVHAKHVVSLAHFQSPQLLLRAALKLPQQAIMRSIGVRPKIVFHAAPPATNV